MGHSDYSAESITLLVLPPLVELPDGRCARTYRYRFCASVSPELDLGRLQSQLTHTLRVPSPTDESVIVEMTIGVSIEAVGDDELLVRVETHAPEEDPVFLFGVRVLPLELERAIGRIATIEGQARSNWSVLRNAPDGT